MCGIFGWILPASRGGSAALLQESTNRLFHRGPDGSGCFLAPTKDESFQLGLGHRRLSIIDLAGGIQPMWSEDRSVVTVFNGEIYNYVELRDELRGLGHSFCTASDTEVLIEAYRAWGAQAVERFRGMFAFALWDARAQSLLLARDPFGKKPLFLAEHHGGLIFGSEIDPLVSFPGMDRGLNWDGLGEYLLNRYVPGPATFFRGIRKLSPGSIAVWQAGRLVERRYFVPPMATQDSDLRNYDEAVALFEATLDEAVRIRMRSDAPFGAFLSGGIDSSAVVALMSRHARNPVRTFSVGFEEAAYSELDHARLIADRFKTDHAELVIRPSDAFDAWPEAVQRRGAPVSEPSDLPILLLSKMARNSVKMVLTGEGSDELLAGYPKHRAELSVARYHALFPGLLHDRVIRPAINALPFGARRLKVLARAFGARDFGDRMRVWFGGVSPAERDGLLSRASEPPSRDPFPYSSRGSALRRILFFDQTSWLPDNLLERGDRMMMAGSIEGRMPFMDTELARVAARMPDSFLAGHPKGKRVLRDCMERLLPRDIIQRKKVGFRVPVAEWFRGPHRGTLEDLLQSGHSETRRLCHAGVLDRLIGEHVAGQQNHDKLLWSLANLEMFLRLYKPSMDGSRDEAESRGLATERQLVTAF